MQSGSLLIDSSTIDPAASQEIEKQAASKGAVYMDSPVSGGMTTPSYIILHLFCLVTRNGYSMSVDSVCGMCFEILQVLMQGLCHLPHMHSSVQSVNCRILLTGIHCRIVRVLII